MYVGAEREGGREPEGRRERWREAGKEGEGQGRRERGREGGSTLY